MSIFFCLGITPLTVSYWCVSCADDIVRATGNNNVIVKKLDLSSLTSVRGFAKDILATEPRLDVLINNAGAGGLSHGKTADGLLTGMQVNHFGPFLLTNLLVGK